MSRRRRRRSTRRCARDRRRRRHTDDATDEVGAPVIFLPRVSRVPVPVRHDRQKEREEAALELAAGDEDAGGAVPPPPRDNRTAAEKRYDEQMEKNQAKIVEKMASKSHRDKVRDFNEYLSKLSEHHDIPKVGPG